jgi:hypothetical protein
MMAGNRSKRALPLVLGMGGGILLAATALRHGVIENDLLPRACAPGGADSVWSCGFAWLLGQSFQAQRLGWFALSFAVAGFLSSIRLFAWIGWLAGVGGAVLYCPDQAVPAALLGLFALLRLYEPGADVPALPERGQGERESAQ